MQSKGNGGLLYIWSLLLIHFLKPTPCSWLWTQEYAPVNCNNELCPFAESGRWCSCFFKDEKLNEVRSKLWTQISSQQMKHAWLYIKAEFCQTKHAWLYSDLLQTEGESGEKEGSVYLSPYSNLLKAFKQLYKKRVLFWRPVSHTLTHQDKYMCMQLVNR